MEIYEGNKTRGAKSWWRISYKVAAVSIVILALAAAGTLVFSSRNKIKNQELASLSYSNAIASLNSEGIKAKINVQAFIDDYSDHYYSILAAMQLARAEINADNPEEGLTQLRWAQSKAEDTVLLSLINLRIARIYKEQGEFEKAKSITETIDNDGWKGYALELKGDIELARGRKEAAYFSYTEAQQERGVSQILQLKLDDLTG